MMCRIESPLVFASDGMPVPYHDIPFIKSTGEGKFCKRDLFGEEVITKVAYNIREMQKKRKLSPPKPVILPFASVFASDGMPVPDEDIPKIESTKTGKRKLYGKEVITKIAYDAREVHKTQQLCPVTSKPVIRKRERDDIHIKQTNKRHKKNPPIKKVDIQSEKVTLNLNSNQFSWFTPVLNRQHCDLGMAPLQQEPGPKLNDIPSDEAMPREGEYFPLVHKGSSFQNRFLLFAQESTRPLNDQTTLQPQEVSTIQDELGDFNFPEIIGEENGGDLFTSIDHFFL